MLLEVAESRYDREAILHALRRLPIAVRGPKPLVVLREWNVPVAVRTAEPNTWHELVTALDEAGLLAGKRVAVQEYGRANAELYRELSSRGAKIEPVPVYRWTLPEDTGPLRTAIRATIARQFDVLLFTSAHQLDCVLEVAEADGAKDAWLQAARSMVVGSIGPAASEALRESGLPVDVEARPTRMGHLVTSAIQAAPAILAEKRAVAGGTAG